jgi:hypothetical protein
MAENGKKGNIGTRSTPSDGPRAKSTGAKPCGSGNDSGRGTKNPVK